MLIQVIQFNVHDDQIDAFRNATLANCEASIQEAGIRRFDLFQATDAPNTFLLTEVYADSDARDAHFATEHFATWRQATESMVADRSVTRYNTVHPTEGAW